MLSNFWWLIKALKLICLQKDDQNTYSSQLFQITRKQYICVRKQVYGRAAYILSSLVFPLHTFVVCSRLWSDIEPTFVHHIIQKTKLEISFTKYFYKCNFISKLMLQKTVFCYQSFKRIKQCILLKCDQYKETQQNMMLYNNPLAQT